MKIYTPATYTALKSAMVDGLRSNSPCAVRYPRGAESATVREHFYPDGGKGVGIRADFSSDEKPCAVIVTHGRIASEAIKAQTALAEKGMRVGIVLLEFLKPYGECVSLVAEAVGDNTCPVITLEEEIKNGGAGMIIADELCRCHGFDRSKITVMAVEDNFGFGKKGETVYETLGLSCKDIEKEILRLI